MVIVTPPMSIKTFRSTLKYHCHHDHHGPMYIVNATSIQKYHQYLEYVSIAFGASARFDLPRCQTAAWHGVAQHVEPPLWPGVSEVKWRWLESEYVSWLKCLDWTEQTCTSQISTAQCSTSNRTQRVAARASSTASAGVRDLTKQSSRTRINLAGTPNDSKDSPRWAKYPIQSDKLPDPAGKICSRYHKVGQEWTRYEKDRDSFSESMIRTARLWGTWNKNKWTWRTSLNITLLRAWSDVKRPLVPVSAKQVPSPWPKLLSRSRP